MAARPLLLIELFKNSEEEFFKYFGPRSNITPYTPVSNKLLADALSSVDLDLIIVLLKSSRNRGEPSIRDMRLEEFIMHLRNARFSPELIPQLREVITEILKVERLRYNISLTNPPRSVSILRFTLDQNPTLFEILANQKDIADIPKGIEVPLQLLLLGIVREFKERNKMDLISSAALLLQNAEPEYNPDPGDAGKSAPLLGNPNFLPNFVKLIELAEKADKERMEQERPAKPKVYVDNYELKEQLDALKVVVANQERTVDILTRALNKLVPGLAAEITAQTPRGANYMLQEFRRKAEEFRRKAEAGEHKEEKEKKERKEQKGPDS